MKKLFFIVFAVSFAAFFASCEGPMGPPGLDGADGADGDDGIDGNVTCMECHSSGNIQDKLEQFNQSVHKAGQIAVDYAGARSSCAQCHSHEGFVEYAANGDVAENISAPSAWECKTCHNIHTTFEQTDYALRLDDAVTLADGTTSIDIGSSNLCANCHKNRRTGPTDMGGEMVDLDDDPNTGTDGKEYEVPAGHFFISSSHWGPHHGPQANVIHGSGFAELSGTVSYPTAGEANHFEEGARCTGCHMGASDDAGQGGHTFNPNLKACNDCHDASNTDFNYGGVQTEVQGLLDDLKALLVDQGVMDAEGHPHVGVYTVEQSAAFFNWVGLAEDRSLGVHNPKYVKALLNNSIETITPTK